MKWQNKEKNNFIYAINLHVENDTIPITDKNTAFSISQWSNCYFLKQTTILALHVYNYKKALICKINLYKLQEQTTETNKIKTNKQL